MTFTTNDCKLKLIEHYPETVIKDWKRVSKYKDTVQLVCRDFEHPQKGIVTIKEINGALSLADYIAPKLDEDKTFYRKVFDKKEVASAKVLLDRYVNMSEEDSENDFEPNCLNDGFKAAASLMAFYFEDSEGYFDSDEDEDKYNAIIKSKNFKLPNTHHQLMVYNLHPKDEISDMCEGFVRDFLPAYFEAEAESLFMVDEKDKYNLTMFDIIQKLLDVGLQYDNKQCAFRSVMKHYKIVDRPETEHEKEQYEIKVIATQAVKNDDVELLKTVYNEKFDTNMCFDLRTIYDYCRYNKKSKCLEFLTTHKL